MWESIHAVMYACLKSIKIGCLVLICISVLVSGLQKILLQQFIYNPNILRERHAVFPDVDIVLKKLVLTYGECTEL